jgi:4-hydroxybenzoyl-CoA thioesterase
MPAFTVQKLVRFQHCDPAGIVFFPQYFQLFNEVVEDWFANALQTHWRAYHLELKQGCPIKKIDTEFFAPSFIGDVLDCELTVDRLGGPSIQLTIRMTCNGELRAVEHETRVQVSTLENRPKPWAPELRERMARYLREAA